MAPQRKARRTLASPSDISNFDLRQNRVSVRTDNGSSTAITNSNLGELDSSKDSDIPFTVSSGTLAVNNGVELWLNFGSNFAPGGDIEAGGNWINNGTFAAGSFAVTLNGTSNQTIGGISPTFFNALTINNDGASPSNAITLGTDQTIGGSLTLTDGIVNTGSNTLTVNGSRARTNGYIIGNEKRTFISAGTSAFTFDVGTLNGYSPIDATVTVSMPGSNSCTVRAVQGQHPSIAGTNALQRFWTISSSFVGTGSADLTFHYLAGDVAGTESLYKLFRYNGSFTQFTPDVLNTTEHFTRKNGVSSFSDWTLAEPAAINPPALGNYPDASVDVSGNTTVTPGASPTNASGINVSTSANFKGTLAANPNTGVIRITDAYPAGTYTVSVTAFNSGTGPHTRTFTLTVITPAICNPPSFAPGVSYSVGLSPVAIAVGDFNNDGIQDLVTATNLSAMIPPGKISVMLGDGNGGFGAANQIDAGSGPQAVTVGDINGDGNQDLAVANQSSSDVSILLGDGLGGFSGATNFSVGSTPFSIVMSDFNGDGKPDLATANYTSSASVSILLGDGNGNFTTNSIGVGSFLISIAVGSLDNDPFPDLVVAGNADQTATVLTGDGAGGFSTGGAFNLGGSPQKIMLGDFNNDNKLDLVSANNAGADGVSVLLGDGSGGFGSFTNFAAGSNTLGIGVGDFDGDGNQDIAAANQSSNDVSILRGDGSGGFGPATSLPISGGPNSVAVGDFNADGKQDLALPLQDSDKVTVVLRQCQPTLTNDTGITVNEDSTGNTVTTSNLKVSDSDNTDAQLTYTLVTAPLHGTLKQSGAALVSGGTFTQADINNNLLTYDHDGSETNSDNFIFTVSDGSGGSIDNTSFNVTVSPVNDNPTLTTNAGLIVGTAATGTIDSTNLLVSDPDNTATQLIFTIGTAPTHGTLKESASNLSGGGTFTQDDINNNRITYVHNGDTASSDSFTFTVSDGAGGPIGTTTFNIAINCTSDPVITNTNDSGAGSLRAAIISACVGSTITFDSSLISGGPATVTLTSGELEISKSLTIIGPGADHLSVSGNRASRVFNIQSGTVALASLTIANGQVTSGNLGGGVLNSGALTLTNCKVQGNFSEADGGGIYNNGPSLTLDHCLIGGSLGPQQNTANSNGGGLFNNGGTLTINGGSVAGNSGNGLFIANGTVTLNGVAVTDNLTNTADGGGISAIGGTTQVINSLVSGNQTAAGHVGGGISTSGGAPTVTIVNSTISGNTGYLGGGGISSSSGTVILTNVTVRNNRIVSSIVGGGGIYANGTVSLRNTIVAGNFLDGGGTTTDDISGMINSADSSFNLIGNGGSGGLTNANNNQVDVANPLLGVLADNGGPMVTHALLPGSPAIDAGSNALARDHNNNNLATDQRGTGFPRVSNTTVDIGAFESRGFALAATGGTLQSATITTAFGAALVAKVSSAFGEPVAGGVVTFTAPASGPSGTFAGSGTTVTATTNGSGVAISPILTANGTAGSYHVSAGTNGAASSVTFSLNNMPATTSTSVASSIDPSDFGQSVTFAATVTSAAGKPVGTVQFRNGLDPLGGPVNCFAGAGQSCTAQVSTSSLTAGTHDISATYKADPDFPDFVGSTGILSGGQIVKSQPSLSINDVSITEGDSGTKTMNFTVTLSAASNLAVNVNFATTNGTAGADSDYLSTSGTVSFNPGEVMKTIEVIIKGDQSFEPNETFFVNIFNPTAAIISDDQGEGRILNDDAQGGIISFSLPNYDVNESGRFVTITVNRTGDTSGPATVDYATPDDSESSRVVSCRTITGLASPRCDFTSATGTLRFAANETSRTFKLFISQDNYVEGPESLTLGLSNLTSGAVLGTPSTATVTIADDGSEPATNPIDDAQNFVRQHYHDFLNREPDADGLNFWTNQITSCGSDSHCIEIKRINVSAAFHLSIEFQDTGYLVERIYQAAYGDGTGPSSLGGAHLFAVPVMRFNEFLPDTQQLSQGVVAGQTGWEATLESNKAVFAAQFVQRSRFVTLYANTLTPAQFVDELFVNTGVTPSSADRQSAIDEFGGAVTSAEAGARGRALRRVAENPMFAQGEFNRAFVLMQYFGYLRRNPNVAPDSDYGGYEFWLAKLNQFNGNFVSAEMVKAFITSDEYRHRFGP